MPAPPDRVSHTASVPFPENPYPGKTTLFSFSDLEPNYVMKDFPYSIFRPACSMGHRLPLLFPFPETPPPAAAFTSLFVVRSAPAVPCTVSMICL